MDSAGTRTTVHDESWVNFQKNGPAVVLCSARLLGADAVLPWGLQEDEEGEEDADTPQAAGGAGAAAAQLHHPRPAGDASRRSLAPAATNGVAPGVNAPVPDAAAAQQHQQAGLLLTLVHPSCGLYDC